MGGTDPSAQNAGSQGDQAAYLVADENMAPTGESILAPRALS